MIPSFFPRPCGLFLMGVLESLGAAGLLLPKLRLAAGLCLIALLCRMFIANLKGLLRGITLRGKLPTPLWLRTPMQILFVVLLW